MLLESHDCAWAIIGRWKKTKEHPAGKWHFVFRSISGDRYPLFTTKVRALRWLKEENHMGKWFQFRVIRVDVKKWADVE